MWQGYAVDLDDPSSPTLRISYARALMNAKLREGKPAATVEVPRISTPEVQYADARSDSCAMGSKEVCRPARHAVIRQHYSQDCRISLEQESQYVIWLGKKALHSIAQGAHMPFTRL